MEIRPSDNGETGYSSATPAFPRAQPLLLAALLATLFALVLWQENPKPAVSTPPIQAADSVGAKSQNRIAIFGFPVPIFDSIFITALVQSALARR